MTLILDSDTIRMNRTPTPTNMAFNQAWLNVIGVALFCFSKSASLSGRVRLLMSNNISLLVRLFSFLSSSFFVFIHKSLRSLDGYTTSPSDLHFFLRHPRWKLAAEELLRLDLEVWSLRPHMMLIDLLWPWYANYSSHQRPWSYLAIVLFYFDTWVIIFFIDRSKSSLDGGIKIQRAIRRPVLALFLCGRLLTAIFSLPRIEKWSQECEFSIIWNTSS